MGRSAAVPRTRFPRPTRWFSEQLTIPFLPAVRVGRIFAGSNRPCNPERLERVLAPFSVKRFRSGLRLAGRSASEDAGRYNRDESL